MMYVYKCWLETNPERNIVGFDPDEFAEWRDGCKWEREYNDDGALNFFLMYKNYRDPGSVILTIGFDD